MLPLAVGTRGVTLVWVAALVAAISWISVGALRRYALVRGVLDAPQDRSSHVIPTPRGGGAGLAFAAIIGFAFGAPAAVIAWPVALALMGVLPTAVAGWIDDHRSLPVLPRLAAHILSGVMLVPLASISDSGPMAILLVLFWIGITVSAINVVNFMDGIDGLIGLQALVFGVHATVLGRPGGQGQLLGVVLGAASAAFLMWNWSPSRIFLGDVGSGSVAVLGLIAGILLLHDGRLPFLAVFLPLYPIFLDAAVAILRRVRRGDPLSVAHRTHLYQRLANEGGWGHPRVSLLYGAAAMLATVMLHIMEPQWAVGLYIAGVTLVGAALDRRTADAKPT